MDNDKHVEMVALLSKFDVDKHIDVKIKLDELDLTSTESKANYAKIKEYILENFGLKVSAFYIAQIKKKCGIELRENYNKSKKKNKLFHNAPFLSYLFSYNLTFHTNDNFLSPEKLYQVPNCFLHEAFLFHKIHKTLFELFPYCGIFL